MNRRLATFLTVFLVVCATGLVYTYTLIPLYAASMRLLVEPGNNPDETRDTTAFVVNEVQFLESNVLLERILSSLPDKDGSIGNSLSLARLHQVLSATQVPGSNVIVLQARGDRREELISLLKTWASLYLHERSGQRTSDRDGEIEEARARVESATAQVARKRQELDDFRRRNAIVSPERDENQIAVQLKGLNTAANEARSKVVDAESRLAALKDSLASGRPVYRAQDNVLITQFEQRALDLRQKLTELERDYTPQYLAMEPRAKALRANLQQLEQQIESLRRTSQQEMLNEVDQEVASLRRNVVRLEAQIGSRRQESLDFTTRFTEYQAKAAEVAQFEADLLQAKQQVAALEGKERAREPMYRSLGPPDSPEKPISPDYTLYVGSSVGAGLILALVAVLLVDFLVPPRRAEPAPYGQPVIQIAYPGLPLYANMASAQLSNSTAQLMGLPFPYDAPAPPGGAYPLAAPDPPPRELTAEEVLTIWQAASADGRLVVAALFAGLTLQDLHKLEWQHVNLERQCATLMGPPIRTHVLIEPLLSVLRARHPLEDAGPVAGRDTGAQQWSVAHLEGFIAAAVHDAGIAGSTLIDAMSLRHTYVSYLVRSGVKLSHLERWVGFVPPAWLQMYSRFPVPPLNAVTASPVFPTFAHLFPTQ